MFCQYYLHAVSCSFIIFLQVNTKLTCYPSECCFWIHLATDVYPPPQCHLILSIESLRSSPNLKSNKSKPKKMY